MRTTYADILADLRLEVTDPDASRWTDAQLLQIVAQAVRRAAHILYRNDIEFGRKKYAFDAIPSVAEYGIPSDFMAPYGLYRLDTNARLQHETADSWELLGNDTKECTSWVVDGSSMVIKGTPTTSRPMLLRYWMMPRTVDIEADEPSPWNGRLDDILVKYAALRLQNIDEMNAAFDAQLLQDMENNILATYAAISPATVQKRGWMA